MFLPSSKSSELNLVRGECDLVVWQAGFAQQHLQHNFPSSETGWPAGQGTLFPRHPHASGCCTSPRCACECLSRVCRWGLVGALPGLRQHRLPCRFSMGSTPLDIQHQQALCQQRPGRKYHYRTELYRNQSPSSAPGRGCQGILSWSKRVSFHCISAALQSEAHQPSRDWVADSLWEFCGLCGKGKSEVVRRKGGIFIFWKVAGRTDLEMW